MPTLTTTMPIESWDEPTVQETADAGTVKRAEVGLGRGSDGLGPGRMHSLLYYPSETASTYVTVLVAEATLDGRAGTLVMLGEGRYDGQTARGEVRILHGTGELAGISGKAVSESTHEDYPNMPVRLDYSFDADPE